MKEEVRRRRDWWKREVFEVESEKCLSRALFGGAGEEGDEGGVEEEGDGGSR